MINNLYGLIKFRISIIFYTIYRITNKINQKFYIGKHQTIDLDDGYMGSGKLIKRAISKYGIDNFIKEILHIFDNEDEMNQKEKELVVVSEESYNICPGGQGGWGYVNTNLPNGMLGKKTSLFQKEVARKTMLKLRQHPRMKEWLSKGKKSSFIGKKHTDETKLKMKKSKNIGPFNSQFGTCWITNGTKNEKIRKEELDKWISSGYRKGRVNRKI